MRHLARIFAVFLFLVAAVAASAASPGPSAQAVAAPTAAGAVEQPPLEIKQINLDNGLRIYVA